MDVLRRGIGLRGLGQRDPVLAYRQEGWDMFDEMVNSIHVNTVFLHPCQEGIQPRKELIITIRT